MKMVAEAYTEPEPHFAQILKVTEIQPIEVYPKAENKDPNAVWDKEETGVTRNGNQVVAKVIAIRSRFRPDRIDAQVGDELTVHVTNIEQTGDMIHGFGVNRAQHQHGDGSGRNEDVPDQADQAGRVSVLLHELLLGAAPGDAGLSGGEQCGPAFAGAVLPEAAPAAAPARRQDNSRIGPARLETRASLEPR